MRLRQRDKLQRSYLLQWYWIDPMSFCGAFQVWLGFMLKGVTLSALHRGLHGGCNAVASFVPYDLKHVSLHLIRQNKKKNQINIKSKSIFACKSLLPSLRKPPNNLDSILKAMCDCGCQGNECKKVILRMNYSTVSKEMRKKLQRCKNIISKFIAGCPESGPVTAVQEI